MVICSIDPGKLGYVVLIDTDEENGIYTPLKYDKTGLLDETQLINFLSKKQINFLLLEKVSGRGGWGATQIFSCGEYWGQVRLVVARYPHKLVLPQTWQKVIHEGISPALPPKDRSLIAYKQLYPHDPLPMKVRSSKPDDNLVDALMIATYGVIKYGGSQIKPWTFTKEVD